MEWVASYVGIPWLWGGRDLSVGVDCWGLARGVLRDQFGKSLPLFKGAVTTRDAERLIDHELTTAPVDEVVDPEPGDLVLIRMRGIENHVGVYVGGGRVLHATEGGSVLQKIDSEAMKRRVLGYYRVR